MAIPTLRLGSARELSMPSINAAFSRQNLLLELETLKQAPPAGIYVAPSSRNISGWTGVMFVLKGPYANAILRFKITFPPDFPHSPPAIVFKTDVFHPLVSPIPALGQKTRNWDSEPMDSDAQRRQIPGMFWLEHGFPHWFGRTGSSSRPSGQTFNFPSSSKVVDVTAYEILDYMRSTFDTESVLTSIPLEAAAHPSAFHAWRAHKNLRPVSVPGARGEASQGSQSGAESTPRKPSEWNWDGVWRERVSRGIQASSNEAAIFGALGTSTPSGDDIIAFDEIDDETTKELVEEMKRLCSLEDSVAA